MNKKIALIACSNGYGHVRRLLLLSQELQHLGSSPTLFAPEKAVLRIIQTESLQNVEFVDFDSQTTISNWLDGTAQNWYKRLPDLNQYDSVVSDNLIEILNIRSDAWLSGSFFWHESLDKFPSEIKNLSLDLLKVTHPKMISTSLFSSPELKDYTNLHEVGLFINSNNMPTDFSRKDILIASGRGGKVANVAKKFVQSLAGTERRRFDTLWVDSCLLPDTYPDWIKPATFARDMFNRLVAVVIRPGVGTVTDALANGARVFPFYEKGNIEMENNVRMLNQKGLSEKTSNINLAWDKAMGFISSKKMQEQHQYNVKKLNLNGASEAARLILQ